MDAIRANGRFHDGWPGFYVVNPETQISNAGPYPTRAEAEAERRRVDEKWGSSLPLDVIEVRLVSDEDCPACGAPAGYPPAGPCENHGTPEARLAFDEEEQ